MKTVFTVLLTLFSLAGFAQTQSGFPTVITNTALPVQAESFEERLQRESLPIGDAGISPYTTAITNATVASGATMLSYGPSPTEMHYIRSFSFSSNEALDAQILFDNSQITPSGVAPCVTPVVFGATGGQWLGMRNLFVPEKSTISIRSLANQGSTTFKFRAGFEGVRVAKDFLKQSKRVLLKIGDSISDGTRLTYGEESYDYLFLNWLETQTGTTWREVSKAKASFRSNDIEGLRITGQLWPKQVDVILYLVGMNDITGNGVTTYDPVLTKVIAEKQKRFPNAIMYVLGPTPSPVAGKPNLPGIRAAAQARVAAVNDATIIYQDLGTSWDSGNPIDVATYTPSTDQVHPVAAGHVLLFNKLVAATTTLILNLIKALP